MVSRDNHAHGGPPGRTPLTKPEINFFLAMSIPVTVALTVIALAIISIRSFSGL